MVLVRINKQFSWYATHYGSVERSHGLIGKDTVILLTVDAKNRGIPFFDEQVRRVRKSALGNRILLFPVCASHIPIGKPFLFCLQVLHLHVEDTIVGNEGFETFVVMSCQPVDGESSEAGTHTAQVVFVNERFFCHFVDCREIILHALATVISADSFVPFHSETRKSAAVRCYNDIAVGSHNLHVPAITPELAYRALWTAFAEEQCRIFLIRIELGRIDDPCQHFFTICRFHPASFNFAHLYLIVDLLVLLSQLCRLPIQGNGINFISHAHRVTFGNQFITEEGNAFVVVHTRSDRTYRIIGQIE